jgi:serine/threonine protein kinase
MSSSELPAGKTLGNYRILEELGRGSMGVVYKATNQSLQRTVALKVLLPYLAKDRAFVKNFLREARIIAKLNHPNLVHVFSVGETGGTYYIAMEYIDGKVLLPDQRKRIVHEERDALEKIRQVAAALSIAHKNDILHRDIKPNNIMVDTRGRVKVTDFGLAESTRSDTRLARDGFLTGSPLYMAPELFEGGEASKGSDLYALGVVLFEMLAIHPPFRSAMPLALMEEITDAPPLSLGDFNPKLSPPVTWMVAKMLARNPKRRYATAEAFLADLDAILAGRAPSVTADEMADEMARHRRKPVQPSTKKKNSKTSRWPAYAIVLYLLLVAGGVYAYFFAGPVSFEDAALEGAVRDALNQPEGLLWKRDLAQLEKLDAHDQGIETLQGLNHCTGLVELNLSDNNIKDITALAALKNLDYLELSRNTRFDLKALVTNPGLGEGDRVYLLHGTKILPRPPGMPMGMEPRLRDITTLLERGVQVFYDRSAMVVEDIEELEAL